MVKVSVIVPVYKVEKYLPACMDSVLGQTLQDLDVICIDDASPDRCPEILDDYAARDARVKVLHLPENHQQGYGRNRGLALAQGEYVYFLDSDDMITATAMEELYTLAKRDQLDGIFFDSQVLYETEELAKKNAGYAARRKGQYEDRVYAGMELADAFFRQREWNCYVQREFWRREFLLEKEVLFPEHTEHEDEFFAFKAILLAQKVRYIPKPYFIRRYREESVMTRKAHPKDFHGYFVNYCTMVELVEKNGLQSFAADQNIGHMYERMLQFYPLFAAQEDPADWFKGEEERLRYYLFSYSQKAEDYYKEKAACFDQMISPEAKIWIYGAGVIGKKAYQALMCAGYVIEGFLVTQKEKNQPVLLGREVRALSEVNPAEGRIAVIAVSEGYQKEIRAALEDAGWEYVIYPTGR